MTSFFQKIIKTIRILQDHALIGTPLSPVVDGDYRYLASCMVFYRAAGKDIFIDRVLYGRKGYLRILFSEIFDHKAIP